MVDEQGRRRQSSSVHRYISQGAGEAGGITARGTAGVTETGHEVTHAVAEGCHGDYSFLPRSVSEGDTQARCRAEGAEHRSPYFSRIHDYLLWSPHHVGSSRDLPVRPGSMSVKDTGAGPVNVSLENVD